MSTLTLKALDRTLHLEAVSGTDIMPARVIATECDAAGKVLAFENCTAAEITIAAVAFDIHPVFRLGRCTFSLTAKGAERIRSWLLPLQGEQGIEV
jgi:hypothetical protein